MSISMKQKNPVKKGDVLYIFTDGASRGNPGHAAIAFLFGTVKNGVWQEIYRHKEYIGETTNNVAEYRAIIKALELAKKYSRWEIIVHSDSELVIKQIKKEYRIKADHLAELCEKIYEKTKFFDQVEFRHVPRENRHIQECDRLCNIMLDEVEGRVENGRK